MTKYLLNRFSVSSIVLTGLALVALLGVSNDAAFAQQEEVIESGQRLFNQKCAICHGLEGKGDGTLGLQLKESAGRPFPIEQA